MRRLIAPMLCLLLATPALAGQTLVLRGGTLVDLSDFGRGIRDVADATVVMRDGRIVAAGPGAKIAVPKDARVVDTAGAWLVPGLNDVFATVNNQAQANAYLVLGVTGIVGSDEPGGRRGALFRDAHPGPRIFPMDQLYGVDTESVNADRMSVQALLALPRLDDAALRAAIDAKEADGVRVLLLYYTLLPDQVRTVARYARKRRIATIGELGATRYAEGVEAGVEAFVHTSRYSLDLAPAELRAQVASAPFGPPRRRWYEFLLTLDGASEAVQAQGRAFAGGRTALIPTLAMNYLDLPGHANPWLEPAAQLLDPADIHLPANRETGQAEVPADAVRDGFPQGASAHLNELERAYCRAGARYLAGSGTTAFGTMPGISLHIELQQLVAACLTPRQALAAATANVGQAFNWPEVGRIAKGANADVLVLDADPTTDIANLKRIRQLVLAGELIDREALLRYRSEAKP
jgi:hypothetical protein